MTEFHLCRGVLQLQDELDELQRQLDLRRGNYGNSLSSVKMIADAFGALVQAADAVEGRVRDFITTADRMMKDPQLDSRRIRSVNYIHPGQSPTLARPAAPLATGTTKINFVDNPHTFNGPLSGTTPVSRYQKGKSNLDFTEAEDNEWQWHQLSRMQVCTSLPRQTAPHHSGFFTGRMPFLPSNQQRQSTEGNFCG